MAARKSSRGSKRERVGERVKESMAKKGNRGGEGALNLPQDIELYQPKKGTKYLDILLYEVQVDSHPEVDEGMLWYERTYGQHREIGPENKTVLCPKVTFGKKCPICEEASRLWKDPEIDDDTARALSPSTRQLFNVVDAEDPEKGVQLMVMSWGNFGKKLKKELEENKDADELVDFAEFEDGKTLKIRWSEETFMKNAYHAADRIDFEDREEDYDEEEWLEEVYDLDALLNPMLYEKLQALFLEIDNEEEEEEKEEKESKRSGRSSKKDKEEEPEEEEEKKSKRTRRSSKKDKEEEPEEEEEKEEKESKRSRKSSKKEEEEPEEESSGGDDDCPHGHNYGEDCDDEDECEECKVWEECYDQKEANKKKRKSKKK